MRPALALRRCRCRRADPAPRRTQYPVDETLSGMTPHFWYCVIDNVADLDREVRTAENWGASFSLPRSPPLPRLPNLSSRVQQL